MIPNPAELERLKLLIAKRTGFHPERIVEKTVANAVDAVRKRDDGVQFDEAVIQYFLSMISLGGGNFFRHSEHFVFLADYLSKNPELGQPILRAWSAGCANGEETYSLAAMLRANLHGRPFKVLGTDILPQRIEAASRGIFKKDSIDEMEWVHYPVLEAIDAEMLRVSHAIRDVTRFQAHNFLDPPPAVGTFHLVVCRNALCYVGDDSVRAALSNFALALAPGGVLLLGSMDNDFKPPGLERIGHVNAYVRRL